MISIVQSLLSATPDAAYYCALAKERESALSSTLDENLKLVGEVRSTSLWSF